MFRLACGLFVPDLRITLCTLVSDFGRAFRKRATKSRFVASFEVVCDAIRCDDGPLMIIHGFPMLSHF